MAKSNAKNCKNYCQRKTLGKKKTVSKEESSTEQSQAFRERKKMLQQGSLGSMNETLCIPSTSNSQMLTSGPSSPPVINEGASKTTKDHVTSACISLIKNEFDKKAMSSMALLNNTQIIDNHQNISESQINLKTTQSSQDMDVDPYLINVLKTPKVKISQVSIIFEDSDENEEMENNTDECTRNVRKNTCDSSSIKNEVESCNTNTSLNTNVNLDNIKITDCKSLIKNENEVSINDAEVVHNNRNSNICNMEYTKQQLDDNVQEIDDSSSTASEKSSNLVIDIDSDDSSLSKLNQVTTNHQRKVNPSQNSTVSQSNLSQNKTSDVSQSIQNRNYVHHPSQTNSTQTRLSVRRSSSPGPEVSQGQTSKEEVSIKKRLRSAKAKNKDKDSSKCPKVRKLSTSEESTQENELLVPRTKTRPAVCQNKWGMTKRLRWLKSSISQLKTSLKAHEEPSLSDKKSVSKQYKQRKIESERLRSQLVQKVEMMNQRLPNETDLEQWKRMKDLAFNVYGVPKRAHATNETHALVQKKTPCENLKQIHTPDILLPSWVKPNKITIKPLLNNQEKMKCQNDKIVPETVNNKLVDYKTQTDQIIMGCMDQQLDILYELNKTTSSTNGDMEKIKPTLNKLIKIQSSMNRAHETLSLLSEISVTVHSNPILSMSQQNSSEQISETPNASALKNFDQILGNSTQCKPTPTFSQQFISSQSDKTHIKPLAVTQSQLTQTSSEQFISTQCGKFHISPLGVTQSEPTGANSEQFISSQNGKIHIKPLAVTQCQLTQTSAEQFISTQCGEFHINPLGVTQSELTGSNSEQFISAQSVKTHIKPLAVTQSQLTQSSSEQCILTQCGKFHKNSLDDTQSELIGTNFEQFISTRSGEIHINPLGTTQSERTQTNSEQLISSQSGGIYMNPLAITQINKPQTSIKVNLPFTISNQLHSLHTSSKRPNPSQSASVQSRQALAGHQPQTETPKSLITQPEQNQLIEDDKSIAHTKSEVDPPMNQNQVQISDGVGISNRSTSSLLQGVKLSEVPRWARTLMPLLLGQCLRAERLTRGARRKTSETLDQNLPMVVMTQTPEGKPLLVSGLCSPHAASALAAALSSSPSTSAARITCISQRLASPKRRSTYSSCGVRNNQKQRRIHNSKQKLRKTIANNKKIQRTRYRELKKANKMKLLLDQRRSNKEDQNKDSTEVEMCQENVDQSNMLHDQNDFGSATASLSQSRSRCSSLINVSQEIAEHSCSEHQQGCDQGINSSTNEDGVITKNVGDESNRSPESVT